jgi:hypothetical protein
MKELSWNDCIFESWIEPNAIMKGLEILKIFSKNSNSSYSSDCVALDVCWDNELILKMHFYSLSYDNLNY